MPILKKDISVIPPLQADCISFAACGCDTRGTKNNKDTCTNGKCDCEVGYIGNKCDDCKTEYFRNNLGKCQGKIYLSQFIFYQSVYHYSRINRDENR